MAKFIDYLTTVSDSKLKLYHLHRFLCGLEFDPLLFDLDPSGRGDAAGYILSIKRLVDKLDKIKDKLEKELELYG